MPIAVDGKPRGGRVVDLDFTHVEAARVIELCGDIEKKKLPPGPRGRLSLSVRRQPVGEVEAIVRAFGDHDDEGPLPLCPAPPLPEGVTDIVRPPTVPPKLPCVPPDGLELVALAIDRAGESARALALVRGLGTDGQPHADLVHPGDTVGTESLRADVGPDGVRLGDADKGRALTLRLP